MSTTAETNIAQNLISKDQVETLRENALIRLTDKVRALDLGIVAFAWAVLSADKPPISEINRLHHVWLLVTVGLAVVSLLLDLLQTVGNYVEFNKLRWKMEHEHLTGAQFKQGLLYKSQNWASALKVIICVGSCLSLLALVALTL